MEARGILTGVDKRSMDSSESLLRDLIMMIASPSPAARHIVQLSRPGMFYSHGFALSFGRPSTCHDNRIIVKAFRNGAKWEDKRPTCMPTLLDCGVISTPSLCVDFKRDDTKQAVPMCLLSRGGDSGSPILRKSLNLKVHDKLKSTFQSLCKFFE